ncbi:MAG: UDP-N-acetylenolpyruvoylglucosamine reductase, partial [Ferruginibacter sp.]
MLEENFSLKKYNTFGINAAARYFSTFSSTDELIELLEFNKRSSINHQPATLVLGGGSNILFTK